MWRVASKPANPLGPVHVKCLEDDLMKEEIKHSVHEPRHPEPSTPLELIISVISELLKITNSPAELLVGV